MSHRKTNSKVELSAKLYVLLDKREAVDRAIEERISAADKLVSKYRTIFKAGLAEANVTEFSVELNLWDEHNINLLRATFTDTDIISKYRDAGTGSFKYTYQSERLNHIQRRLMRKMAALESLRAQMSLFEEVSKAIASKQVQVEPFGNKVFIVHGHDDGVKQTVARFLEKLDLDVIILHEQPNMGKTLIEKLETNSSGVDIGYAVILLTPDDEGKLASDKSVASPRARQNVTLELGYFIGKLGRERVCALQCGEIELPTDILGVAYIPFDSGSAWQFDLAKELKAVDFEIDLNKLAESKSK